ncbi:GspE/PulE family protein [Dickeya dadantii]|uniref:GspE/PulE family protein n=1 Tax=Dickeya dadantii TaxID=204038 RepID=UPI0020A62AAA|nr:ATPase, T2SS/T4P/T4SS family [Dickeya dadantii]
MKALPLDGCLKSYKIDSILIESIAVTEDKNKKTLHIARSNSKDVRVMDYIRAFKSEYPDSNIQMCNLSEVEMLNKDFSILLSSSQPGNNKLTDEQTSVLSIISAAINYNASDIHIRLFNDRCNIYFRVDGLLRFYRDYGYLDGEKIIQSMYHSMCEQGTAGTFQFNTPIDARIKEEFLRDYGLSGGRFASRPTHEKVVVVIRLLAQRKNLLSYEKLGVSAAQRDVLERVVSKPTGIVITSGPVNSGKSTLTECIIESVALDTTKHVITVQDPVECLLANVVQTNLGGAEWGDAIANILRLDPDVISVGEIRETKSATGCVSAAQTGRKVYTTLHTNYAIDIPSRLLSLGVEKDLVFDPTLLVCLIGQRLAPRLCDKCKKPYSSSSDKLRRVNKLLVEKYCSTESVFLSNENGCEHCKNGYSGRVGLFEIIETNGNFMERYQNHGKMAAYKSWYESGGDTICRSAIGAINDGIVDPVWINNNVCSLDRDQILFG